MLSTGAVGMTGFDDELRAEETTLGIDCQRCSPTDQVSRHEERDAVILDPLVRAEVFACHVGVDRHLRRLASTNRANEVEGDIPALLLGQRKCCLSNSYVHTAHVTRTTRRAIPNDEPATRT